MSSLSIPVNDGDGRPQITPEMEAENKGQHTFEREATCTACHFDVPQSNCEVCAGEVRYLETITVPWETCKEIFERMVMSSAKCGSQRKGE